MPPSPKGSPRISIRDVARSVGVSIMTVSLALRNHPKISEATRLKIQAAAKELGYRPDPEIARLMVRLHERRVTGSGQAVAIVDLSDRKDAGNDYGERVRSGAIARAEALGYIASGFHAADYGGDLKRMLSVLHHRGIAGILLIPPSNQIEIDSRLDWSGFSVIAATYAINPAIFHCVVPHQFLDLCALIRELHERGYRRVGAVFEANFDERTHYNFTAAMMLHGHGERIFRARSVHPLPRGELLAWLHATKPEIVVSHCATDLKAAVASFAGEDNSGPPVIVSLGQCKDPGLAYWDERPEFLGDNAASLLTDMMLRHESGIPSSPRTSMIHGEFHAENLPLPTGAPATASAPKARRATKRTAKA